MVLLRIRLGRMFPRDERGAVAVLTALLMVGLMIMAAIVVDLGMARDVRRQSQNASDAASLAGAIKLYPNTALCPTGGPKPCFTEAVDAVKSYALQNFQTSEFDWANNCQASPAQALANVASSGTNCISFDSGGTLVRVYMPTRTLPTLFGRFAGSSSIPVGSSAEAQLGTSCSLCFLGPVDAGNGDFSVSGGSIAVNGSVTAGPGSIWTASSIGIVGAFDPDANPTPAIVAIPPFGDPLASSLPLPVNEAGLVAKTDPCGPGSTHGPGLYSQPVGTPGAPASFPNGPGCALQPGLYVVSNKWLLGNFPLKGARVSFYVTGPLGELDFKNGDVVITAPTAAEVAVSGGIAGYVILYDPANVNAAGVAPELGLQGSGGTLVTGVVYAPKSILNFNGTSVFGFSGGPIVLGGGVTNGTHSGVTLTGAESTTLTLLHLKR